MGHALPWIVAGLIGIAGRVFLSMAAQFYDGAWWANRILSSIFSIAFVGFAVLLVPHSRIESILCIGFTALWMLGNSAVHATGVSHALALFQQIRLARVTFAYMDEASVRPSDDQLVQGGRRLFYNCVGSGRPLHKRFDAVRELPTLTSMRQVLEQDWFDSIVPQSQMRSDAMIEGVSNTLKYLILAWAIFALVSS